MNININNNYYPCTVSGESFTRSDDWDYDTLRSLEALSKQKTETKQEEVISILQEHGLDEIIPFVGRICADKMFSLECQDIVLKYLTLNSGTAFSASQIASVTGLSLATVTSNLRILRQVHKAQAFRVMEDTSMRYFVN